LKTLHPRHHPFTYHTPFPILTETLHCRPIYLWKACFSVLTKAFTSWESPGKPTLLYVFSLGKSASPGY